MMVTVVYRLNMMYLIMTKNGLLHMRDGEKRKAILILILILRMFRWRNLWVSCSEMTLKRFYNLGIV